MIPHFVLVFDILPALPWIIFEGPVTESTLHWAIEFRRVLGRYDETFVVVVIVDRLLQLPHAADELLDAIRSIDDAIRFEEGGEVTLDFVSHSAWSMLKSHHM